MALIKSPLFSLVRKIYRFRLQRSRFNDNRSHARRCHPLFKPIVPRSFVEMRHSGNLDSVACSSRDTNAFDCPVILLRCARRWHPEIRDSVVQSRTCRVTHAVRVSFTVRPIMFRSRRRTVIDDVLVSLSSASIRCK